jgi:hypothetical protein
MILMVVMGDLQYTSSGKRGLAGPRREYWCAMKPKSATLRRPEKANDTMAAILSLLELGELSRLRSWVRKP